MPNTNSPNENDLYHKTSEHVNYYLNLAAAFLLTGDWINWTGKSNRSGFDPKQNINELHENTYYKPFNKENGGFLQHLYVMFIIDTYFHLNLLFIQLLNNPLVFLFEVPLMLIESVCQFLYQLVGLFMRTYVTANEFLHTQSPSPKP